MKSWIFGFTLGVMLTSQSLPAGAGTTGGIEGQIVDSVSHKPLADVRIIATAASQSANAITDANGDYRFLSLGPDVYTLHFEKTGFSSLMQSDVAVFADEIQTINRGMLSGNGATSAVVSQRTASSLVRHGSVADVYSVSAGGQKAAVSLAGPGSLNQAYGAILSVPGTTVVQDVMGYQQQVRIRGGDWDQVGWEIDGVPVNLSFNNGPQHLVSTLGQQELQVYTGGTPAYADASGIAGYVNQVIRTGTYPGFVDINSTVGSPAFYHKLSVEAGGSSENRRLSYYVGFDAANQDYRYIDNSNGADQFNSFSYPVHAVPGNASGVFTGAGVAPGTTLFTTGVAFSPASTSQRDVVANLHYTIPRRGGLSDDLQVLYESNDLWTPYYSSQNDLGATIVGPLHWDDGRVYTGALLQPVDPSKVVPYSFPGSPAHAFGGALPLNLRDGAYDGSYVTKLQYQHSFGSDAFLRFYAYANNGIIGISGPNAAAMTFGGDPAQFQIPQHTFGGNLNFTDQINTKNLLTASTSITDEKTQRTAAIAFAANPMLTTLIANGNCVNASGAQVLCYGPNVVHGSATNPAPFAAPGSAAWLVTENGLRGDSAHASSQFTAASLTDQWQPSDRLTVLPGIRADVYRFYQGSTNPNDPAREFWFAHYNAEHCFAPGMLAPVEGTLQSGGTVACPAGEQLLSVSNPLVDASNGVLDCLRIQPRFGITYDIDANTVVRGSFGVYARPPGSLIDISFDSSQEDLASVLGSHFYGFGYATPLHAVRPDTSFNEDLSLEHQFPGTDWSFKITPFYRSTKDQIQNFAIDQSGIHTGANVGRQFSEGVEVALQKGDFDRDGISGRLSYTYTYSRIRYQDFDNTGFNVIDRLNSFVQLYNSYTSACATPNPALCGNNPGNAQATFTVNGTSIPNPYFNQAPAQLLDRNGFYMPYEQIPSPFTNGQGYEIPHLASLILNYRHKKFAFSPSFVYSSGSSYGSPLSWEGFLPQSCTSVLANGQADPVSCGGNPIFIPNAYSGKFDGLGAFQQPWRFSAHLSLSYDLTPRVSLQLGVTNLVDHCGQRGYAWDAAHICQYSNLTPNFLNAPAGNFFPNSVSALPPPQLKYPYGDFFDVFAGRPEYTSTTLPVEAWFNLNIKV